jgi:hypothetical protein
MADVVRLAADSSLGLRNSPHQSQDWPVWLSPAASTLFDRLHRLEPNLRCGISKGGNVFIHVLPNHLPDVDLDVRLGRAFQTARTFIREAACLVEGHNYLLETAANRIFLRCANCGHETPGWHLGREDRGSNKSIRSHYGAAARRA